MLIFFKDFYSPSRLRVLTLYLYRIGITNVICRPSVQTVGRPLAENRTWDSQYDARTLDRQTTIPRALLSLVHCVFIFFKIRIRALVLFCIRFIWVEPKVLLSCFHPELKPSSHFFCNSLYFRVIKKHYFGTKHEGDLTVYCNFCPDLKFKDVSSGSFRWHRQGPSTSTYFFHVVYRTVYSILKI